MFSVFGVIALVGVIATAAIAKLRKSIAPRLWLGLHQALSALAVGATLIHALQIQGAMEPTSKWAIAVAALAATVVSVMWRQKRG